MDAFYIAEKCPLLGSAFQEVLRLHITSNGVRYVEQPTTFGEKILGAGHQLMIPLRQLNHSERIWGTDHDRFDPERFLKNKTLASHTAFRPFGGGINLCPGKSFASRQVLSYVAYLLYTLDISLPPRKGVPQQIPLKKHETLAFGVSVPKRGMDLELELRASKNAPIREVKMVIPGAPDDKL
jgi:cytochrome P450